MNQGQSSVAGPTWWCWARTCRSQAALPPGPWTGPGTGLGVPRSEGKGRKLWGELPDQGSGHKSSQRNLPSCFQLSPPFLHLLGIESREVLPSSTSSLREPHPHPCSGKQRLGKRVWPALSRGCSPAHRWPLGLLQQEEGYTQLPRAAAPP